MSQETSKLIIKFLGYIPTEIKTFLKKFKKFNSINKLDKKMLKYINYSNGYYLECGANDGVNQSNTWYFEKCLNWSGILIEPHPKQFVKLKNNRKSSNLFFDSCLVSNEYKKDYIFLTDHNLYSSASEQFDEKKYKVKTATLQSILEKSLNDGIIDFFSLDVQGYELDILKGVDLNRYLIKYILVETGKFEKVKKYLEKFNYCFLDELSRGDYLFKKS